MTRLYLNQKDYISSGAPANPPPPLFFLAEFVIQRAIMEEVVVALGLEEWVLLPGGCVAGRVFGS